MSKISKGQQTLEHRQNLHDWDKQESLTALANSLADQESKYMYMYIFIIYNIYIYYIYIWFWWYLMTFDKIRRKLSASLRCWYGLVSQASVALSVAPPSVCKWKNAPNISKPTDISEPFGLAAQTLQNFQSRDCFCWLLVCSGRLRNRKGTFGTCISKNLSKPCLLTPILALHLAQT